MGVLVFHEILGNNVGLNEEVLQMYCKYATKTSIGELLNALDNYGESPLFILARNKQCSENMLTILKRDTAHLKNCARQPKYVQLVAKMRTYLLQTTVGKRIRL